MDINFLPAGTVLNGKYVIEKALNCHPFYKIYLARCSQMDDRKLLIQEYFPASMVVRDIKSKKICVFSKNGYNGFKNGLSNFLEQSLLMKNLNDIKGIAGYVDVFEENDTGYRVADWLEGFENLKTVLRETGKLNEERSMKICLQIIHTFQKLHKRDYSGILLGPSDIMLEKDDRVFWWTAGIDFQLVNSQTDDFQAKVIFYPEYAPLEAYHCYKKTDVRMDVYTVGAVMYHMLTGVVPIEAHERLCEDGLLEPKMIEPTISDRTSKAVMKALMVNGKKRFRNMIEFERALTLTDTRPKVNDLIEKWRIKKERHGWKEK